jgi:L-lactate dehydrogenase complex protein LldG
MNSRDEILNRLRSSSEAKPATERSDWQDKTIFSDYPRTAGELLSEFRRHIEILAGELHVFESMANLAEAIPHLLHETDPEKCRSHHHPLIEAAKSANPTAGSYLKYIDNQEIDSVTFADIEVGITGAEYLVARTGSIMLRAISAGGRRLSVLPPTHVVIATSACLVYSLDEVLKNLNKEKQGWSYATFITGPSRTSDIEKQLVLGAHGPKRLIILLLQTD